MYIDTYIVVYVRALVYVQNATITLRLLEKVQELTSRIVSTN